MHVETLTLGPIETNCFVAWDGKGRALVIDPSAEPERIIDCLRRRDAQVLAYLITHGHADHISALADVHDQFPAPIAMHPTDSAWAFETVNQIPFLYGTPRRPSALERELAEGQTWRDGSWTYEVLETPGHSPGSVSFHFPAEQLLFSGDVLFQGSAGRTDLPGGDAGHLTRSLKRLARLPDQTVVYPGHGPATTIGKEKATNYFLQHGMPG